jgi:hypothetical protein
MTAVANSCTDAVNKTPAAASSVQVPVTINEVNLVAYLEAHHLSAQQAADAATQIHKQFAGFATQVSAIENNPLPTANDIVQAHQNAATKCISDPSAALEIADGPDWCTVWAVGLGCA